MYLLGIYDCYVFVIDICWGLLIYICLYLILIKIYFKIIFMESLIINLYFIIEIVFNLYYIIRNL